MAKRLVERKSYTYFVKQNDNDMTTTTTRKITKEQAKKQIKKMKRMDIDRLNTLANRCDSSLAAVTGGGFLLLG